MEICTFCYIDEPSYEDYLIEIEKEFAPKKSRGLKIPSLPISLTIQEDYQNYFNKNPNIKAMSIDRLDATTLSYFLNYLEELELTGKIDIPPPINLGKDTTCFLSDEESIMYIAAKMAHSIWKDKNEIIPWRLKDYNNEELDTILSIEILCGACVQDYFDYVADYSPSFTYNYSKQFLFNNKNDSLFAIIKNLRNFRHGFEGEPEDCISLEGALLERRARSGCHSMVSIVLALAKSLNIPCKRVGFWIRGHASALFYGIGYLPHGDDFYNIAIKYTPSSKLICSWDYWKNYIEPEGNPNWFYPNPPNCNFWAHKFYASRRFDFVYDSVLNETCGKDIEAYVRGTATCSVKGIPTCTFNEAEIQKYINTINNICLGDIIIYVYSIPFGANIYLNDTYIGITNGAFKISPGTYTLKLTKAGYEYIENFTISTRTKTFDIVLESPIQVYTIKETINWQAIAPSPHTFHLFSLYGIDKDGTPEGFLLDGTGGKIDIMTSSATRSDSITSSNITNFDCLTLIGNTTKIYNWRIDRNVII